MHELSICQSLISMIENEARRQSFHKVRQIHLEIGRFAAVDPEALRFGFEVASRDTLCEGAELHIIDLPGIAYCFTCEETVALGDRLAPCPKCGGGRLQATGGDELKVKDLEVI
ncbi:MAG TPA: hydrogenase maturation nickel metallochaperone HypA [Beijerinckia sp.]|jgi:hydrogenase nickel incorporation protein HypA/HybF|nr:hydrogenase maturation nickel metallochaperone HypA [Beijerinckia sp.]